MKIIDKKSRMPLYSQLMDIITEKIEKGSLKEDDRLPSERELCEEYNISRATVRQAIQELEKDGYIYKEHGKGTFVSPVKIKQNLLKLYSFHEEMTKLGKVPTSEVIFFQVTECNEKIARKMNLFVGESIYKFIRLRRADNKPMMIETNYVLYDRFPGIVKDDLEKQSMYDIFTKRFNVNFTMAEETLQPVITKEDEAELLGISKDIPSMMIERTTYEGEKIIEYTVGIARGDKFKYSVVLKK